MSWDNPTLSQRMNRVGGKVSLPNQARAGRSRWNLVAPVKVDGAYISIGNTDKPYGRSTHHGAYLSHAVRGILVVWQKGKLLGCQVVWNCGARSLKFQLLEEPNSPICPLCILRG